MNDVVIVKDTTPKKKTHTHSHNQKQKKKQQQKIYQGQTGGRSVHNFNELW